MGEKWTKETWIQSQLDSQPKARRDVLEFIWDITTPCSIKSKDGQEVLTSQFASGYCYYFALILKDAFDGEMMWVKGRGHIVWCDTDNHVCYDSWGVYQVDISRDGSGEPVTLELLGSDLESFRHRGHDFDVQNEIKEYCNKNNITEDELTEKVCNSFPPERRIFTEPNVGDLYRLWNEWAYNKENHLDDLCKKALQYSSVVAEFNPDDKLYDELVEQMCEINLLQSQDWIDKHPKKTVGTSTANCGMTYYCDSLDKHFRLEVTRWTPVRYELLVNHVILKAQPLEPSDIFN